MKIFNYLPIAIILMVASVMGTTVKNCPKSKARPLEDGDVNISLCPGKKCVLKHNTEPSVAIKIVPNRDFKVLTSDIQGIILDVPLPFVGYYGTSACPYIYDASGEKQVGCPLKANETYIYKNSFKVLPYYPTVSLEVHWGLGDENGDAACFRIPAKITR